MYAVGLVAAIAFQVITQLPFRGFNRLVDCPFRKGKTFRPKFEMVDDSFHTGTQLCPGWRYVFAIIRSEWSIRQLIQCLLDYAQGMAQLLHPQDWKSRR